MFERFTKDGRQVVVLAQEEARALRHGSIGTEHLLLGLLRQEGDVASAALASLNITVDAVRGRIDEIAGRGESVPAGQIPFTTRAKGALELALREALSLGHSYIGAEHVLLGLVREEDGVAARILADAGATPEVVRDRVLERLVPRPRPGSGPGSEVSFLRAPWRWQWEYRVEHDLDVDGLNEVGAESWELVTAIQRGESVELLFKRSLRGEMPGTSQAAGEVPDPEPGDVRERRRGRRRRT